MVMDDLGEAFAKEMERYERTPRSLGYKPRRVLGVWKPRSMANPIYDSPLVLSDVSTMKTEDAAAYQLRLGAATQAQGPLVDATITASASIYHDRQRFYYFPDMTDQEALVFTHYIYADEEAGLPERCGSFHGPVHLPLPDAAEPRKSVDFRITLWW